MHVDGEAFDDGAELVLLVENEERDVVIGCRTALVQ